MDKKNVIVLVDSEEHKSSLLFDKNFGMYNTREMMCIMTTPHYEKAFNFQVFKLDTNNPKLMDYIKTKDGIIILITHVSDSSMDQIHVILKDHNVPIMLYFDNVLSHYVLSPRSLSSHAPSLEDIWGAPRTKLTSARTEISNSEAETYFKKNLEPKYPNFKVYSNKEEANYWFTQQMRNLKPKAKVILEFTSKTIPIESMAKQFEDATLPITMWDHYGRLRIVHYSLMKYGYKETANPTGWLCSHWKAYKTSINHGHLWHYTLTRFWMTILYDLQNKHKYTTFDDLFNDNPQIQSGNLFKSYYTDDVLFTPHARSNWVYPNLKAF